MAEKLFIDRLADGDDYLVGVNRYKLIFIKNGPETFLVIEDLGAAFEFYAFDGLLAEDAFWSPAISNLDTFG